MLHNLGSESRDVSLKTGLSGKVRRKLINLLSEDHSEAGRDGIHRFRLEGYGYRWYRMGGLADVSKRSDA